MKKLPAFLLTAVLVLSLLSPMLTASADQPPGYWPYFTAYEDAVASGNTDAILSAGDALLNFYAQFPMSEDIASMSYNIYLYRYEHAIFESRGDYDTAIANAKQLIYFSNYLGFTDMAIAASARAKKLDPMTEVYAVSEGASRTLYYGARNEPETGTYYGRVADWSGSTMRNETAIRSESIVSVYVKLGQETAADYAGIIGRYDDTRHVLHIALNFPEEAATASEIVSGACDSNIRITLRYLASLKSNVLLRIGGEMNLWEMDASLFKSAYTRVANLARSIAPKVALVWSPNYVGSWGSNIGDFYPGDSLVDWVGLSLYCNSAPNDGCTPYDDNSMYFGHGAFSDCVLSAKEAAEFASGHNKPVIVTEGGTGIVSNGTGTRYDAEAAAQITKRYSVLNMVYPNIKAIVYFDVDLPYDPYQYAMDDSAAVVKAYGAAVSSNPTLLSSAASTAPSYVKLTDFIGNSGSITLSAYGNTIYGGAMTVTYSLAGRQLASLSSLPYRYSLDTANLAPGKYEFRAVFNDGAGFTRTKLYTLVKLSNGTALFLNGYDGSKLETPADWASPEVSLATELKLVPDEFQYLYTSNITRLDFCSLVINLIEKKTGKSIEATMQARGVSRSYSAFSDAVNGDVLAAYALGIVNGRGGGVFDCYASISREEAAKMLKNAGDILGIKPSGTPADFADAAAFSSWASEAIRSISATLDKTSGKAVMGGVGGGCFDPKGTYTYQQAYITMLRLCRAS